MRIPPSSSLGRTLRVVRDAMLGALLICSKEALAALPGVEIVSTLLVAYAVVYRARAFVPLYVFVAVEAVLYPSFISTIMYLYIWAILVGAVLLLPKRILPAPVYMLVSGLFGLLFGTLCAPAQALYFGLTFQGMWAWIIAGLPFDIPHGISNAALGLLVPPLCHLLKWLEVQS